MPANVFLVCLFFSVDRNFHAVIEETIRLRIVEDIEADFGLSSCIFHLEEEPLCVALRIDVVGHEQVILSL